MRGMGTKAFKAGQAIAGMYQCYVNMPPMQHPDNTYAMELLIMRVEGLTIDLMAEVGFNPDEINDYLQDMKKEKKERLKNEQVHGQA